MNGILKSNMLKTLLDVSPKCYRKEKKTLYLPCEIFNTKAILPVSQTCYLLFLDVVTRLYFLFIFRFLNSPFHCMKKWIHGTFLSITYTYRIEYQPTHMYEEEKEKKKTKELLLHATRKWCTLLYKSMLNGYIRTYIHSLVESRSSHAVWWLWFIDPRKWLCIFFRIYEWMSDGSIKAKKAKWNGFCVYWIHLNNKKKPDAEPSLVLDNINHLAMLLLIDERFKCLLLDNFQCIVFPAVGL